MARDATEPVGRHSGPRPRERRRGSAILHGPAGHPIHPPLTDLVVGAFTVGSVAAVLGAFGVAEEALADTAFVAVCAGLIVAAPTALAGVLDYLTIPRGTPLRRAAAIHWVINVTAVAVYLVAAVLLEPGPGDGNVRLVGAIVSAGAWALLLVGGWLGGTMVFRYGMRVIDAEDEPVREAVKPTHLAERSIRDPAPGAR
jgi:uncharacterized membrane protein